MLKEVFQYFSTPTFALWVKKMGFLYESIAMSARYRRCEKTWQPHFEQCQQSILEAVSLCQHHRTILIMGAGSLKDIPLSELSQQFQKVCLVDLVFLSDAKQLAQKYPNVELIEADVTGCLASAYQGTIRFEKRFPWHEFQSKIDCVVSLNLAMQLPLVPVKWMMKRFTMMEKSAGEFGKAILENHLSDLNTFPGIKCLIADRWTMERNENGELIDEFDPAWEVDLPEVKRSWDWQVIPLGESYQKTSLTNRVGLSIWH